MKIQWLESWEFWNHILYFLQTTAFITAGLGIIFLYQTLQHQEKIDSANLIIKFDEHLNKSQYTGLMDELDSAPATKILNEHGGHFSERNIDSYLGEYETLGGLYYDNLKFINCNMVWDNFSYDLEKAYKNKDIQFLVAKDQMEDSTFWEKFQKLGKEFNVSKNPCSKK